MNNSVEHDERDAAVEQHDAGPLAEHHDAADQQGDARGGAFGELPEDADAGVVEPGFGVGEEPDSQNREERYRRQAARATRSFCASGVRAPEEEQVRDAKGARRRAARESLARGNRRTRPKVRFRLLGSFHCG